MATERLLCVMVDCNFEQFTNTDGIYKFRIDRAIRVSCSISDDGLILRYYGHKNYVYPKET